MHSIFELRERDDHRLYSDRLVLHVLELEKLPWPRPGPPELKRLDLESMWLYLIRHGHELPKALAETELP